MSVQDAAVSADPALSPAGPLRLRTLLLLAAAVLGCAALLVAAAGADHLDGQGGGGSCKGDAADDVPADC